MILKNGWICLGIFINQGTRLPWDDHERWDDIDDWWLSYVLKWMPSNKLYDKDGEYIGGIKPPAAMIDRYYREKREFIEKSPRLPIKLVNGYMAIPSTFRYASYSDVDSFASSPHSWEEDCRMYRQEIDALLEFCRKYEIETGGIGMLTWVSHYPYEPD